MPILNQFQYKTILISPLDWGFGHTTRCVSLINTLLRQQNKIIFAGNELQCKFIKQEFPKIKTELINGYNIQLSSQQSTYWQILKQGFKILKSIKKEHIWVKDYIKTNSVDLIISDNRYGFRHSDVQSFFMGHQFNLELPILKNLVNSKLLNYINAFDFCWVVDDKDLNLAGELSNLKDINIPFDYIGILSRFNQEDLPIVYDYLIIISGPKPENELFLKDIELHFKSTPSKIAIISTVPSNQKLKHINYFYNPTTKELNNLINQSKTIISRAGYTTLMELIHLHKKAILIPTKGQYEQEYLAKQVKNDNFTFVTSTANIPF